MSEIPIFTLASANYISTNDHVERAGTWTEIFTHDFTAVKGFQTKFCVINFV